MRFPPTFLLSILIGSVCHAQMGPSIVLVAPVERQVVDITQPLVASVEAVTRTTVAAEQEGVVVERMFDEGQTVERGAVLAKIDIELLRIQRDASEAARLAAASHLDQAEAEFEQAQRELARIRQLYEGNVAPEKEYFDRVTQEKVAAAIVATRKADLQARQAEVDHLDVMIRKSVVLAPLTGVIAARHIEIGQWIQRGDPVADLVQLDPLHVRVNVPENIIALLKRGDEARVSFDALRGESRTGKIDQIIPVADVASRSFAVKILLPNSDHKVWPGFFARAVVTSPGEAPSFMVPRDAVISDGEGSRVVVARDSSAVVVPVVLGEGLGSKVSVTGELTDADVVVIRGNESLRGGEQLMIQNAMPPATTQSAR